MKIAGIQKLTLTDYPEKLACIVFTQGCNYNCYYCYNKDLIPKNGKTEVAEDDVLKYLTLRQGFLKGVCICGGEPTIQDLKPFIKNAKELGYIVKIDTNGSNPEVIKELIDEKLIDYVAMDIKTTPQLYEKVARTKVDIEAIEKSIKMLIDSDIDYEFRTTIIHLDWYHDILDIIEWFKRLSPEKKAKKYCLQQVSDMSGKPIFRISRTLLYEMSQSLRQVSEKVILRIKEKENV